MHAENRNNTDGHLNDAAKTDARLPFAVNRLSAVEVISFGDADGIKQLVELELVGRGLTWNDVMLDGSPATEVDRTRKAIVSDVINQVSTEELTLEGRVARMKELINAAFDRLIEKKLQAREIRARAANVLGSGSMLRIYFGEEKVG